MMCVGYYIHSCIKMRYKGTFAPTYILGMVATYKDDALLTNVRPRELGLESP